MRGVGANPPPGSPVIWVPESTPQIDTDCCHQVALAADRLPPGARKQLTDYG